MLSPSSSRSIPVHFPNHFCSEIQTVLDNRLLPGLGPTRLDGNECLGWAPCQWQGERPAAGALPTAGSGIVTARHNLGNQGRN